MKKVYRMSLSSMKSIKVINNDNAILMSKLINIKRNKLIKILFSFDLPFLTSLKRKILLLNDVLVSYALNILVRVLNGEKVKSIFLSVRHLSKCDANSIGQ
jgi:hypothetical protein